ncbi:MAG: hypothetical protein DHS20C02_00910 [Micavibrio sp.]|nr:MAG: hypothetical protein DHS20C02_00910 [Micavibrio sp.]
MSPEATVQQISTALGVSWASGINLYATILVMGFMHNTEAVVLPEGIDYVAHPMVMIAAGAMFCVEFFADKIPGIDTAWDGLHTFIRIPAGIAMAYGAAEGLGPVLELSSALIGGGLAATSHATKAGSRVIINASPEPVTNWTASFAEDFIVLGGVWTALTHPWIFLCLLGLFILLAIWLLPKIWRGIKKIFGFIFRLFGGKKPDTEKPQGEKQQEEEP